MARVKKGDQQSIIDTLKKRNSELQAANKALQKANATSATKNKRLQTELGASEKLLDSVFHTADIGLAIVNSAGRFVKVNNGLSKLTGYKPGELQGNRYTKIIDPHYRKEVEASHQFWLWGKILNYERKIVCANGALRDVYVTNNVFTDAEGERYLVKTIRDVTESKKYRDLMHDVERELHIGGFEYDVRSKTTTWTDEIYNIFELDKDFNVSLFALNKFRSREDNIRIRNSVKRALLDGTKWQMDFAIITQHKNKKWLRINCNPIRYGGKTIKLFATVQDITAERETEMEIERLTWVAKHTNNGVIITDSKGKTSWVNESFERMSGYLLQELVGKTPGVLLQGPGTDKAIVKRISQQLRARKSCSEIMLNYTKEGKPIWIKIDITPIFKDKQLINFIGISTDLTNLIETKEIQEAQAALLEKQKLFNALAMNFPDGIIGVIDERLNFIFGGGKELGKWGTDYQGLVGENIFDNLWPDANKTARPYLERAFKGESVSFEIRLDSAIYNVNAVPLTESDERVTQVLIVIQNITLQKNFEDEMMQTIAKQKELSDLKSKFVTIASHEFRTPLSTILSSIYLMEKIDEPKDRERKIKHIARIRSAVSNLTEILNEFLSVGKIEEGSLRNKPELIPVKQFCQELVEEMTAYAKEGQVIEYRHKGETNNLYLDGQHLKNVLINLISNAIKYSPAGKAIDVTSETGKRYARFSVKDNGIGIPEDDKAHLFETFFRAKNAGNIQGTGMGLHIVKKYLDIMGGTISVHSKLDEGTTFTISFPIAKELALQNQQ